MNNKYYSQSKEDQILYDKFFKNYTLEGQKYFFEMGAIDGIMYNNTKFFEDTLGWKGLLVEGNPLAYTQLVKNRPNCALMNAVVSNSNKPLCFRVCLQVPAVCSVADTTPENFERVYYKNSNMVNINTIPVPLDTVFKNSGLTRIDLAVLDVEGHELSILESYNFNNSEFTVVSWLIETFEPLDEKNAIKTFMESKGYTCFGNVAHNAFFIKNDYIKYFNL